MASGLDMREIKRIRNEILVALKVVYPAALQADQILRSLIVLFPTLEFDSLKRDLHYLMEKHYIEVVRTIAAEEEMMTSWRRRWFRLTTSGMEVVDHCIADPALDEG